MLDAMPVWARDLAVALLTALATWAGSDLVPILEGRGGASALAAAALVLVLNALLPWLTRAYGVGASTGAAGPRGTPGASGGNG